MLKNFLVGLSNLKYYFKTIWNDRQTDYIFVIEILIKKLQKTEEYWGSCTSYEHDYDDKEKLQEILAELKKIKKKALFSPDDKLIKHDLEKVCGKLARLLPKLWD